MSKKELNTLFCPFCGAPYRQIVQADTIQLKCHYCGGTFVVPQQLSEQVRCTNHPEKLPVGLCNDCGGSFCGDCLHVFKLQSRQMSANLFLCPDCLMARHMGIANGAIVGGLFMAMIGLLMSFWLLVQFPRVGAGGIVFLLFLVFGLPLAIYGAQKRKASGFEEPTVNSVRTIEERMKDTPATPEAYNRLLSIYLSRFGPKIGYDLLRNEISERMRRGQTFWEAVWFMDQAEKSV